jgi:hypothetical protein
MIANLLNALLGLWLVYVAVLDRAWAASSWKLGIASVAAIALALWARASDYRKWQSSVNVVLGGLMLILAALEAAGDAPPLLVFWGVFWPGALAAIFALWSVLYRPRASPGAT